MITPTQLVVITERSLAQQIELNASSRQNDVLFVSADSRGLFGSVAATRTMLMTPPLTLDRTMFWDLGHEFQSNMRAETIRFVREVHLLPMQPLTASRTSCQPQSRTRSSSCRTIPMPHDTSAFKRCGRSLSNISAFLVLGTRRMQPSYYAVPQY